MFQSTKSPISSLTIQASAVVILLSVLSIFGVNINPDAVPQLSEIIKGIAAAVAVFGRFRANTLIG